MRSRDFILAMLLVLAPFGARSADLVVWWEKGFYAQEDEAVRAIHRVVTEGISPEQAVDETIARIKQVLSE